MLGMLGWGRNNREYCRQLHFHFSTVTDFWFKHAHESELIRNSETGYDYLFKKKRLLLKNNRLLFSLLFCDLKIPKQGIKMQIFFLNGLWRLLKTGHLPVKLHSSAPPPPPRLWSFCNYLIGLMIGAANIRNLNTKSSTYNRQKCLRLPLK